MQQMLLLQPAFMKEYAVQAAKCQFEIFTAATHLVDQFIDMARDDVKFGDVFGYIVYDDDREEAVAFEYTLEEAEAEANLRGGDDLSIGVLIRELSIAEAVSILEEDSNAAYYLRRIYSGWEPTSDELKVGRRKHAEVLAQLEYEGADPTRWGADEYDYAAHAHALAALEKRELSLKEARLMCDR